MPRRRQARKIVSPPGFISYKPEIKAGKANGYLELYYEEYEAIKLADYELLTHLEASKLMGVSRATFARIYESARRTVGDFNNTLYSLKQVIPESRPEKGGVCLAIQWVSFGLSQSREESVNASGDGKG